MTRGVAGGGGCCCRAGCESAAYVCVLNEASGETGHTDAVVEYCGWDEYSTSDPIDNAGMIHSLVSTTATGLPPYLDTGRALVGLELCVHVQGAVGGTPTMSNTDCHVLDAVYVNPTNDDAGETIVSQIVARFGNTTVRGKLNPHPRRIYFIADGSGSYWGQFWTPYDYVYDYYIDAGFTADQVNARFGAVAACEHMDAVGSIGGRYFKPMVPTESWFAACVAMMGDHTNQ